MSRVKVKNDLDALLALLWAVSYSQRMRVKQTGACSFSRQR